MISQFCYTIDTRFHLHRTNWMPMPKIRTQISFWFFLSLERKILLCSTAHTRTHSQAVQTVNDYDVMCDYVDRHRLTERRAMRLSWSNLVAIWYDSIQTHSTHVHASICENKLKSIFISYAHKTGQSRTEQSRARHRDNYLNGIVGCMKIYLCVLRATFDDIIVWFSKILFSKEFDTIGRKNVRTCDHETDQKTGKFIVSHRNLLLWIWILI